MRHQVSHAEIFFPADLLCSSGRAFAGNAIEPPGGCIVIVCAGVDHKVSWIRTLCHHAAIVSRFTKNFASAQHYYEESLAADPENARALYGLATVALDQGQLEIAKQYATRCRTATLWSDDEILKQGLLDLLVKHWPDIAENSGQVLSRIPGDHVQFSFVQFPPYTSMWIVSEWAKLSRMAHFPHSTRRQ